MSEKPKFLEVVMWPGDLAPACFGCGSPIHREFYLLIAGDGTGLPGRLCLRCVAWALGEMVQGMKPAHAAATEEQMKAEGWEPGPAGSWWQGWGQIEAEERLAKLRLDPRTGQPLARRQCCGKYIDNAHAEGCPHRKGA